MRRTRWQWRITGIIGFLATILLLAGFYDGIQTILYPSGDKLPDTTAVQPPENHTDNKEKIQILALGDSLTKGFGDSKAEGYAGRVKKLLERESNKPVYLWNFAVNGAETKDLLAEINRPTASDYITQADIILFTIGGNDLNRIAAAPSEEAVPSSGLPEEIRFNFQELSQKMPASIGRLNEIVDKLAQLNPGARIVYLGLYHPYLEFDPEREGAAWIGKWNDSVFQAANKYPNVTVVPTYDLFQLHWRELLYTDHFHPNEAGYEEMAARVIQVLK